jgi:hypothetical protein
VEETMLKLRIGMMILSFLAFAGVSHAAIGTVDMTWDGCTGPVDKTTNVAAPYSIFVTVIGHDEGHKGYDVRIIYGNASQQVPDAWRFDANGCEGSSLVTMDFNSKACPRFQQNSSGNVGPITKVEFSPPFDPYPVTLMRALFAWVYSPDVTAVNPGTRYLLVRIGFDLSQAVPGPGTPGITCGGFEEPMCFRLSNASFLDTNNVEKLFNRSNPMLAVSFNGAGVCPGAVPAKPATWGSIKGQYRN